MLLLVPGAAAHRSDEEKKMPKMRRTGEFLDEEKFSSPLRQKRNVIDLEILQIHSSCAVEVVVLVR